MMHYKLVQFKLFTVQCTPGFVYKLIKGIAYTGQSEIYRFQPPPTHSLLLMQKDQMFPIKQTIYCGKCEAPYNNDSKKNLSHLPLIHQWCKGYVRKNICYQTFTSCVGSTKEYTYFVVFLHAENQRSHLIVRISNTNI